MIFKSIWELVAFVAKWIIKFLMFAFQKSVWLIGEIIAIYQDFLKQEKETRRFKHQAKANRNSELL